MARTCFLVTPSSRHMRMWRHGMCKSLYKYRWKISEILLAPEKMNKGDWWSVNRTWLFFQKIKCKNINCGISSREKKQSCFAFSTDVVETCIMHVQWDWKTRTDKINACKSQFILINFINYVLFFSFSFFFINSYQLYQQKLHNIKTFHNPWLWYITFRG